MGRSPARGYWDRAGGFICQLLSMNRARPFEMSRRAHATSTLNELWAEILKIDLSTKSGTFIDPRSFDQDAHDGSQV